MREPGPAGGAASAPEGPAGGRDPEEEEQERAWEEYRQKGQLEMQALMDEGWLQQQEGPAYQRRVPLTNVAVSAVALLMGALTERNRRGTAEEKLGEEGAARLGRAMVIEARRVARELRERIAAVPRDQPNWERRCYAVRASWWLQSRYHHDIEIGYTSRQAAERRRKRIRAVLHEAELKGRVPPKEAVAPQPQRAFAEPKANPNPRRHGRKRISEMTQAEKDAAHGRRNWNKKERQRVSEEVARCVETLSWRAYAETWRAEDWKAVARSDAEVRARALVTQWEMRSGQALDPQQTAKDHERTLFASLTIEEACSYSGRARAGPDIEHFDPRLPSPYAQASGGAAEPARPAGELAGVDVMEQKVRNAQAHALHGNGSWYGVGVVATVSAVAYHGCWWIEVTDSAYGAMMEHAEYMVAEVVAETTQQVRG
ncbi:MAG: hypothetical protein GY772_02035, partial [bacterium]|nr:hypothetical protein [bacterium]